MDNFSYVDSARSVFELEANSLIKASSLIDNDFSKAISAILATSGRVIICGMGKSGIVGKKIAATLASTGTPSFFMHPGEAYHGDLGMVKADDVFIAISNSGETDEVIKLIPFLKTNSNYLIALTGNPSSSLAKAAHLHLNISVEEEACPHNLAPTSSTTVTMAMGDALAVTLMKARGFQPENFARFHPGGALGRRLLGKVEDEMAGGELPVVHETASILELLQTLSQGRLGVAIVKHSEGFGVVTDGDVRRAIQQYRNELFNKVAKEIMTRDPIVVSLGTRIEDAMVILENKNITSLLVVDKDNVVGVFKK